MSRVEQITWAWYQVKFQWECEFDVAGIGNQKPEMLTHVIEEQSPLHWRHALYGDRNEAMRLYYKVRENGTNQYVDIMSFYPYICKYFKFPTCHSVIQVGDACKYNDVCLRMDIVMKCSIVLPERLYHTVLPFRCNKKLLFCLCRSCVLEDNIFGKCKHTADVERTLTGTWVIDEVRLAVKKGYKILKFYEV